MVGQGYTSLAGILDYRNGNSKLELRGAADVVLGAPALAGFAPATSFVDVGQTGAPTVPTPLTVQLTNAPAADTFVAITSGDPTSLTVVGGGVTVLAGTTSAPVLVNGLAQSAGVTLTATLGASSLQASVRVVGAAEQPDRRLDHPEPGDGGARRHRDVHGDPRHPRAGGRRGRRARARARERGHGPGDRDGAGRTSSRPRSTTRTGARSTSATVTATLGTSTASATITSRRSRAPGS